MITPENQEKTQITQLPWCVTTKRQGHRYIGTEDGTPIAFTATPREIKSECGEGESWLDAHNRTEPLRLAVEVETDANVEYIVRACNSFPALLAALEGIIPVAEAYSERLGASAIVRIDQARAAIAAAKAP